MKPNVIKIKKFVTYVTILKGKQLLKETLKEKKYILLPPDILKKVCVKVESESKYFVR